MADSQPNTSTRFKKGLKPWNAGKTYRNLKNSEKRIDRSNPLFLLSLRPAWGECGVYAIINRSNGRIYIGSSVAMGRRVARHRSNFVKKSGASKEFMQEMIESPEDFEFSVIETTKTECEARDRERFWISFYQSTNPQFGYNRSAATDRASGFKWTKEAIARRTATSMKNGARRKPVEMLSLSGSVMMKFESQKDAAKFVGKRHNDISSACHGKIKTAFGYKWRFA